MTRPSIPLSRSIAVKDVPRQGLDIAVEATADERARVARDLKLVALDALTATYHITTTPAGARVKGEVRAHIRQTCVVSLEEFDAKLREPVDLAYAVPPRVERDTMRASANELVIDPEAEDPPEPIVNGRIDLGAVTVEFLALGIDPYPRKPGVEFAHEATDDASSSPFAALAELNPKTQGSEGD